MIRNTILMLTVVIMLAACGQTAPAAPTGATEAPSVASGKVSFMVFGDPAEKAAYAMLVDEFKKRNSAIEVELVHIPDQADYRKRLAADIAAGTPADVLLINYRRLGAFAAKGLIEPLGPYLAQSKLMKEGDYYTEALAAFRWQGTLMCIPQNVSSLVVYYNKQLFDQAGISYPQAGWTWDDFVKTAQALTKDTNGDGTIDQYGLASEIEAIRLAPFIWQNGGDLVDNATSPKRLALGTPEARAAFQWFVDLQVKHHVLPDAAAAKSESSDSRFLNGRLGMLLNSRRVVPTLREISSFDWDVAPLPQSEQSVTVLHADAYCMPTASRNKPAAWAFIEFANAAEGQAIVAKTGRTVPSLKAVATSAAFLDPNVKPQHSQVFLDVVPQARALPILDTWADIEETITAELQRALYGEASVPEAVDAAERNTAPYFR
ncbi:MAG TPA: sugar ABC transporter substrate-binding protein [Roseiflexaceae bacterium]|nr:sugar ABC transporter substrate-binding protein [Roseiflexaceae bacterium]